MDYLDIYSPIKNTIYNIYSKKGIQTILTYLEKSNLENKDNLSKIISNYTDDIEKYSYQSSLNSKNNISEDSQNINDNLGNIKIGRFTIVPKSISFREREILSDSEFSYSSSYSSDYSSQENLELYNNLDNIPEISEKIVNNDRQLPNSKNNLTQDEIKWGKTPLGYIRKGRFLIKK